MTPRSTATCSPASPAPMSLAATESIASPATADPAAAPVAMNPIAADPAATTPGRRASGPDGVAPPRREGLYGPRGWSVRAGVRPLLAACRDDLRSVGPPAPARPGPEPEGPDFDAGFQGDDEDLGGDAEGPVLDEPGDDAPFDDYTPFHDLGPQAAARLLEVLPEAQLADRQNLAPTLGSLLRACARADGRVRLSGYAIGPRRPDERVTVEALWIADPDLLDMEVHDEHDEGCRCRVLWDTVRERYGLDARALPDEMRPMRRQWTHGQVGTWLWWD
ncbi:hypothetical protein [Actinomyces dentalis]|uniref:hypothetical protein n=1 Tax=Actinomyces dentalis TaxID=272548 RepID=UPI002357B7B5|nr:hypothetical protein [Actinomyces dentalis]